MFNAFYVVNKWNYDKTLEITFSQLLKDDFDQEMRIQI